MATMPTFRHCCDCGEEYGSITKECPSCGSRETEYIGIPEDRSD